MPLSLLLPRRRAGRRGCRRRRGGGRAGILELPPLPLRLLLLLLQLRLLLLLLLLLQLRLLLHLRRKLLPPLRRRAWLGLRLRIPRPRLGAGVRVPSPCAHRLSSSEEGHGVRVARAVCEAARELHEEDERRRRGGAQERVGQQSREGVAPQQRRQLGGKGVACVAVAAAVRRRGGDHAPPRLCERGKRSGGGVRRCDGLVSGRAGCQGPSTGTAAAGRQPKSEHGPRVGSRRGRAKTSRRGRNTPPDRPSGPISGAAAGSQCPGGPRQTRPWSAG